MLEKEVARLEENLSAQKGYQEKGSRFYEENVYQERQKGSCEKKS
jgi:hypothetical protein